MKVCSRCGHDFDSKRCKKCQSDYDARRYAANGEKEKERQRQYRQKPGVTEQYRDRALQKQYGISLEEYNRMNVSQNSQCDICHGTSTKALCVDHCHKTGRVRKLLCTRCNYAIGLFDESIPLIESAIRYLRENPTY